MNVRIKRLLSMLVVMAMIATMIVPMNFSAVKAEETETPETESAYVNPGQEQISKGSRVKRRSAEVKDAFLNATGSVTAVCPVCASEQTWTAIDSTWDPSTKNSAQAHYYLATDINHDFGTDGGSFLKAGHTTCINLNGKTVNITNGLFLNVSTSRTVSLVDTAGGAVVTGSWNDKGATIRTWNAAGSDLHLYGGTYKKAGDGATASIVVQAGSLNVYEGATISGATNTGNAGNVALNSDDTAALGITLNLYGGIIEGGTAKNGGNVYAGRGATVNVYDGAILNGKATGTAGNIYCAGAKEGSTTALNIYGGFIGGGDNLNIYLSNNGFSCSLTMEAGTVVGGLVAAADVTAAISGASKIVPSAVYNGETYTGTKGLAKCSFDKTQLTEGADIWVNQAMDASYTWCPECKSLQTWATVTEAVAEASGHYRFKSDLVHPFASAGNNSLLKFITKNTESCVDLNGCDVTVKLGRFLVQTANCTVNVMDMVGGAVVTADCDRYGNTGRTVMVSAAGAELNLKGGTYKGAPDGDDTYTNAAPVARVTNGTLNLYEGATIDGRGLEQDVATVYVGDAADTASIFNLEGGTVYGATHTSNAQGGAFTVGDKTNSATLNVKSGTIYAGNCAAGEAIMVKNGNTVNISGGLILPYEGSENSVIYMFQGTSANISGGVIVGQIYLSGANDTTPASAVTLSGAPVITSEYTVGDTTYTSDYGLRPRGDALVNVDGLTADADIYVSVADYNVPFTTAYTGDVDMSQVLTTDLGAAMVVKNADNQLMFAKAAAMIGDNKYTTTEEALTAYDIANGEKIAFTGEAVIAEDIILDAANSGGAEISGTGTIYGIDTTNDDFSGYKKITVTGDVVVAAETVDAATGYRYMALKEGESTYGFHRFETKLTHVTLRTTAAGLYYKAAYQCDTLVRDRVLAYGVALSVQDMPDANFLADNGNLYTVIEGQFATEYGKEDANTVKTTSGSVFGILKALATGRTAEANTAALTTDIYANSYILVDTDGNGETQFFMADTANGGKKRTDEGFTGTARNLLEVVNAINDPAVLKGLTETQMTNLVNFANAWVGQFDADGEAKWAAATSNIVA